MGNEDEKFSADSQKLDAELERLAKLIPPKRLAFVNLWLLNNNGLESYLKVYKNCKSRSSARNSAARLLALDYIKKYIDARQMKALSDSGISYERHMQEEKSIAYSTIKNLFDGDWNLIPPSELPDEVAAAISSLKVKGFWRQDKDGKKELDYTVYEYKFWDKSGVQTRMAKYQKLFDESDDEAERMKRLQTGMVATAEVFLRAIKDNRPTKCPKCGEKLVNDTTE